MYTFCLKLKKASGFELTFQSCIVKNCMVNYDWATMIEPDKRQKIL